MGWTQELINAHLAARRKPNGKIYFRASDVSAAVEKTPGLHDALMQNAAERKMTKALQSVPMNIRLKQADELSQMMDHQFEALKLNDDVLYIASIWHHLFIMALQKQNGPSERILSASQIRDSLSKICHKKKGRAEKFAESWISLGRASWVLLEKSESIEDDIAVYLKTLVILSKRELHEQLTSRGISESVSEILSAQAAQDKYPCKNTLYECYMMYYIPDRISRDLSQLIAIDPKDEYPEARQMNRHFEIHVGGTNTGKTYESLQKLKNAKTGVYLAPLRLLALEVQERLLEAGVVCSMLTGEEEDLREGATHISSTVEKLNLYQQYDVAVIDECQMINDESRGFAWTRAILGVQAEEIHLCVAPEGLNILIRLINELGEPFTIVKHERKVPLLWQQQTVKMKQAQKGDAFVAFSKKRVLQMAEELRKEGIPTSIIYGNLPYATRRQQMQMFLDGETTALVATDAIGMGLNLPIRRVIFTEDCKYDGSEVRLLRPGEVRQIAGRAGRFGIYSKGYAAAGPDCDCDLETLLETVPNDVTEASLGFSDLVLRVDRPLVDVLKVWNQMPVKSPYRRMDISRHIFVIHYVQSVLKLDFSREDLLRASNIPFDEKDPKLLSLFGVYCTEYDSGANALPHPERTGNRLGSLELYYKMLDLYYSVSKVFHLSWDDEWLVSEKEQVAEEINYLLIHDLKRRGASCRSCGSPLPIDSPYSICDRCHKQMMKRRKGAS